jgi:6-phosphogluconolactonase
MKAKRLIAFVGTYGASPGSKGGGIYGFEVEDGGEIITQISHCPDPKDAGYLVYAPDTKTLYAVDERKTDGRGPVNPPSAVWAFAVQPKTASLKLLNWRRALGPRPTFLNYSAKHRAVISANHGDFQHVEKLVKQKNGTWGVEYLYDDSTLNVFDVQNSGKLGALRDVYVFDGHGKDPNSSPQNGGHAQSNSHAHCAVINPTGQYVLTCDKGTDRIYVFKLGKKLKLISITQMPPVTAPRHLAFDATTGLAFVTCEMSSELASFSFDEKTGKLKLRDKISTLPADFKTLNEPAEVRVHPKGGFVYVNNRGEDAVVWFSTNAEGKLKREGSVSLAKSIHPGLAARSFTFSPDGAFMLVADRPAHLLRSYGVDPISGALTALTEFPVPDPAYIEFVEI